MNRSLSVLALVSLFAAQSANAEDYCFWDRKKGSYTCHDFANAGPGNVFSCGFDDEDPWTGHTLNWIPFGIGFTCLREPQNGSHCCFSGPPTLDNSEFVDCAAKRCMGTFEPFGYDFHGYGEPVPTINDSCQSAPTDTACMDCCDKIQLHLNEWCAGDRSPKCQDHQYFIGSCYLTQCGSPVGCNPTAEGVVTPDGRLKCVSKTVPPPPR